MRRTGYLATLVAGLALLGASLHGMTRVDATLRVAAAPAAPKVAPGPEFVRDRHDCHRGRHHPRV
jgi:hypothetical protein